VTIKPYIDQVLIPSSQETSFTYFIKDAFLYIYLNRSFGKYVHLYLLHYATKKHKFSNTQFSIDGSKLYYLPIKAQSLQIDIATSLYFLPGYTQDGVDISDWYVARSVN